MKKYTSTRLLSVPLIAGLQIFAETAQAQVQVQTSEHDHHAMSSNGPMMSAGMGAGAMGHDMHDDPLLLAVNVDQLEYRDTDAGAGYKWESDVWLGKDLYKLWLKSEGETESGRVTEQQWQLLARWADSAFGDWQAGIRHDSGDLPDQDWLVAGWVGTAPYMIQLDTAVFIGDSGQTGWRIKAEQEWMLTQRWELVPSLELNLYSKADPEHEHGSGLADADLGLRLKYRVDLHIKPYIGINYARGFGATGDYRAADGGQRSDWQAVAGVSFWY